MLPEVEQYFETVQRVRKEATEQEEAAARRCEADGRGTERHALHLKQVAALHSFRDTTVAASWTLLGGVTVDPFAAWIAANFGPGDRFESARSSAELVLRELPLDQARLEEFAESKGWCEEFEGYLNAALEAGVFAASEPGWRTSDGVKAALAALDAFVDGQVSPSKSQRERLHELVLAVASAAVEADTEAFQREGVAEDEDDESVEVTVTPPARESAGTPGLVALDVSEWPEWVRLRQEAVGVGLSGTRLDALRGHVGLLAARSAVSGVHTVESSAEATALRSWVSSIGGESRMGELRRLVEPIVVRAARS